jgi:hypothetical protein
MVILKNKADKKRQKELHQLLNSPCNLLFCRLPKNGRNFGRNENIGKPNFNKSYFKFSFFKKIRIYDISHKYCSTATTIKLVTKKTEIKNVGS